MGDELGEMTVVVVISLTGISVWEPFPSPSGIDELPFVGSLVVLFDVSVN